jgi:hypothetical protein
MDKIRRRLLYHSLQKEQHLNFTPGKPISDFWPIELKESNFVVLVTKLVVIVRATKGK